MRYVTIKELSDVIRKNIWKVPHDVDLVVGVPRSGIVPASIIALYLNVRLTDIDSFLRGDIFSVGYTRENTIKSAQNVKKVLVVDDSVNAGLTIGKIKEKLKSIADKYELIYLSPIVRTQSAKLVDIFFEVIDEDRIFEWNLFHHSFIGLSCLDLDGVMCCDPKIDDDGEEYLKFLQTATPLFIPTVKIGTIITCRLEKYRSQTEAWLKKYNIQYDNLVMLNFSTKEERVRWGKHGEYKGEYFKNSPHFLFIESSYSQALKIAKISHKNVICIESNSLLYIGLPLWERLKIYLGTHYPRLYKVYKKLF